MNEKISSALWRVYLVGYALALIPAIILCIQEPQDLVQPKDVAVYPLIGLVLFLVFAVLGTRLEKFLDKYEKYLLVAFFVIYTLITVRITLHSRGVPVHDQASLLKGAQYMAGLTEEMNWTYFGRYNHNIIPMLFASLFYRVAAVLHIEDGYYVGLTWNILQVLCVLYCVFKTGRRISRHGSVSAWMGMIMMAVYIPVWGHTQSLYTDALSFCYGFVGFYIWLCNYEKRKSGWKYWLINVAAGIVWGIGFEIKATAIIPLIAVLIYLVLFEHRKTLLKNMAGLVVPVAVIAVCCSAYIQTLPSKDYADTWGVPSVGYFIGIGLEGNGGFNMDSEYLFGVTNIYGMAEKKAFSRAYILEHLDQFVNPDHVIAKVRHNFATGVMRADDFMSEAENHGFLYNCISYGGAYRDTYRTYVTSYWYMFLEWIVIACVLGALRKRPQGQWSNPAVCVPLLAVGGISLYVMLFEANNRQFYNSIPMIICAANIGIWSLYSVIEAAYLKRKNANGKWQEEQTSTALEQQEQKVG